MAFKMKGHTLPGINQRPSAKMADGRAKSSAFQKSPIEHKEFSKVKGDKNDHGPEKKHGSSAEAHLPNPQLKDYYEEKKKKRVTKIKESEEGENPITQKRSVWQRLKGTTTQGQKTIRAKKAEDSPELTAFKAEQLALRKKKKSTKKSKKTKDPNWKAKIGNVTVSNVSNPDTKPDKSASKRFRGL